MFTRWRTRPKGSALLLGPRRAGKSTWLRSSYPGHTYATFDDLDHLSWAERDPKGFIASLGPRFTLDEVQRFPKVLIAAKHLLDERKIEALFTGSSQSSLLRHGSETLAGRIEILYFPSMCWGEEIGPPTHRIFDDEVNSSTLAENVRTFESWYRFGGFPEVRVQDEDEARAEILRNYRNTYFTRDLAQLENLENVEGLLAIFHQMARGIGSLVDISSFARESGLSHPTAKKYLQQLALAFIAFKLYGYELGPAKRYIKAAKTYFSDIGIPRSLRVELAEGAWFEQFVISELEKRRALGYYDADALFYSRSKDGAEIDLIIEQEKQVYAIEIKSGITIRPRDLTNLERFISASSRKAKAFCIYRGTTYAQVGNVKLIPVGALRRGF